MDQFDALSNLLEINPDEKGTVSPFILSGKALSHFTRNFSRINYSYDDIIDGFRRW